MTSCAATTTIREALEHALGPQIPEHVGKCALGNCAPWAALASLEQLVKAAQAVAYNGRLASGRELRALAVALAAVGPGEETAA